jgi:superfamily I DNA/RNA helicase
MAAAEPVIRAVLPDANVPTSVRSTGVPVRHGHRAQLTDVLQHWLVAHHEGTACVLGADDVRVELDVDRSSTRVRALTPELAKGLEFDLVVLLDTDALSAVDRYVAMTRATQQLVVLR